MLSLSRLQQRLRTLIEALISEAIMLNYVMQLHQALAAWEQAAIERILSQPAVHVDETSLRVERKHHWFPRLLLGAGDPEAPPSQTRP